MRLHVTLAALICSLANQACNSPQAPAPSSRAEQPPPAAASAPVSSAKDLVAAQHPPEGDVEFQSVLALKQASVGAEPMLRGGRVAVSKEWPASLYATFKTPRGMAACTAALVGPQAMLTAAHCVPRNGRVTFKYEGQQRAYVTSCTQHPQYVSNQDASADYALCKLDRSFAAPTGFRFETINTAAMNNLVGGRLILTGYGCVSDIAANGSTDGNYRIGFNSVDHTSQSPDKPRGADLYTPAEDNNLFTKDGPDVANLCPGDSGGPAFQSTGGADAFTNRVIVGVNSRVFYRDQSQASYGASLVSATGGPDFIAWATEWARTTAGGAVCGLAGSVPNCRS
jgi:hypothetical protein